MSRARIAFHVAALAAAVALLVNYLWLPTPQDGDSVCFTPAAIEFAQTGKLTNPFFNPLARFGANPENKLVWHGFLYPMVLAQLAPRATYPVCYATLGVLGFAVVAGWSWAVGRRFVTDPASAIFFAGAAWCLAGWYAGVVGRSEAMTFVLVTALVPVAFLKSVRARAIAGGIAAGLAIAISPQSGVALALIIGCYLTVEGGGRWRSVLGACVIAGASAIAAFGASFAWYPYTLREWLQGLAQHSSIAIFSSEHFSAGLTLRWWLLDSARPLFAVWLAVGLAGFLHWGWTKSVARGVRLFFVALFAGLVVELLFSSKTNHTYNAAPFLPLALFVAPRVFRLFDGAGAWMRRGVQGLAVATAAVGAVGLVIPMFCAARGTTGLSYAEAREKIAALQREAGSITVSWGLFAALPDHAGADVQDAADIFNADFIGRGQLLIVQQVHPYKAEPPRYRGYTLVESHFTAENITVAGLKVANSPLGWNFCVYRREAATPVR